MENDALFTFIPEKTKRRKKEKQHLYKLASQTGSKSQITTVTVLSIPLGVYQLNSSHCGQNSKDIQDVQAHSKDVPKSFTLLSKSGHLHLFRPDVT
ncbi:hypothetical protein AVEN_178736-1 [Araneus ventricosus]|uniref:Uncharacterized protein n=1 Tax=Araneus ventricosus TaxID=182803 RepID=A0A4Y2L709_ARAVE|nr:hypothetical protein AVEN_234950-1 [Araneus ventricosus]GBN09603.1 hypothetical protein AVEN_178736-1 [Araneus ventricosus]